VYRSEPDESVVRLFDSVTGDHIASTLLSIVVQAGTEDALWTVFGYPKRPTYGKLINRFLRNQSKVQEEQFLFKEFIIYSLVQVVFSIRLRLSLIQRESVVAKILAGLLADEIWAAMGFPSRGAAIQFYETGVTRHYKGLTPDSAYCWNGDDFLRKARLVVTEDRLPILAVGAAHLRVSALTGLRTWMDENIWECCDVTSPATISDRYLLGVASRILAAVPLSAGPE